MKKLRFKPEFAATALTVASLVFPTSTPVLAQTRLSPDVATSGDQVTAAAPAADSGVHARVLPDKSQSPQQRRRVQRSGGGVYKASIQPHWLADNTRVGKTSPISYHHAGRRIDGMEREAAMVENL